MGVTCELVAFGRGLGVPNTVKAKGGHREIFGDQVLRRLPPCVSIPRKIHKRLGGGVRGNAAAPGEYRRIQNVEFGKFLIAHWDEGIGLPGYAASQQTSNAGRTTPGSLNGAQFGHRLVVATNNDHGARLDLIDLLVVI